MSVLTVARWVGIAFGVLVVIIFARVAFPILWRGVIVETCRDAFIEPFRSRPFSEQQATAFAGTMVWLSSAVMLTLWLLGWQWFGAAGLVAGVAVGWAIQQVLAALARRRLLRSIEQGGCGCFTERERR
jgi:signal transduction histidine kinase